MMIKILSVTPEIFPLIKTGGLADVTGALPLALQPLGVEVVSLVPGYPAVLEKTTTFTIIQRYDDLFGGPALLLRGTAAGLSLFVLAAPHLYNRPGNPYLGPEGKDWPDNAERFAALSYVAAEIGLGTIAGFTPDIVHCHDWQTGLTPAYLHYAPQRDGQRKPRSVLTIHNLSFPGRFPLSIFPKLKLPEEALTFDAVEYYGGIGYLKAGLQMADALTTVSPSYAEEILTPEWGMGLDGLLRYRQDNLTGITNGIDIEVWDPAHDDSLDQKYSSPKLSLRKPNKREVEQRFGLENSDALLFCMITRLTLQKGIDLMIDLIPDLVAAGGRLAVLGSGEASFEAQLEDAVQQFPGAIGFIKAYDEPLSHLMQGGCDAIIIPSRFEPCGLTQLYGLRYGCVPIVARVGGLADTVITANDAAIEAGVATGLQFSPVTTEALGRSLQRAFALYADKEHWKKIQLTGMATDVSWQRSAKKYLTIYQKLIEA